MPSIVNKDRSILLQRFVTAIGSAREPFVESGRKFDKVYIEGKVRYFVARTDMTVTDKELNVLANVVAGDIGWISVCG